MAVEALLQTMTTDSHGLALHQASSDALTQILGQVQTHELVEKRRGKGRKGKKLAMQLNAGKAAGGDDGQCAALLHAVTNS